VEYFVRRASLAGGLILLSLGGLFLWLGLGLYYQSYGFPLYGSGTGESLVSFLLGGVIGLIGLALIGRGFGGTKINRDNHEAEQFS
jgi:hypothetical protein